MPKIKTIQLKQQPSGKFQFYTQFISFDNGEGGIVYSKTADKWKVGDKVNAVPTGEVTGGKLAGLMKYKLEKEGSGGYQNGSQGGFNSKPKPTYTQEDKSIPIMASVALKIASEIYIADKCKWEAIEEVAISLARTNMKIENALKTNEKVETNPANHNPHNQPSKYDEENDDNDDIPF